MKLSETDIEFLDGKQFSNGYHFKIGSGAPPLPRNDFLAQKCAGQTVLHIGCVDHVPLIRQKRAAGVYLHDRLATSASRVVGADVNSDGLAAMRQLGITDLYHMDDIPQGIAFDLVVVPDVIEHVPNVGLFLRDLARFKAPILITTPNAFRLLNRRQYKSEAINSDHRYWFSPYSLCRSVVDAGFIVADIEFTDPGSRRNPFHRLKNCRYPLTCDGLAVTAAPPDNYAVSEQTSNT